MKYLTNSGLSYFLNKIKAYLTSSTYLNSIGIFPNNDNSVDLGDSSKNIKMIYTEGITINGTQFLPSNYATLSGLSTVATSGSYNDLTNKPTIPTVNNGTLTITVNGTTVGTFTANQATNEEISITTSGNIIFATEEDISEMAESWSV